MSSFTLPYLVGVATVDVTPAVGTKLAGFATRTADSTGVYLPLRAIVTAITDRETNRTVIIVSIEWLGFYDHTDDVRSRIHASTGVPERNILLCGTHTHYGPPMRKHVDADCRTGIDEPFLRATFGRIAATAHQAMAQRAPAALRSSVGWCGLAYSRRKPDGNGGVLWMPTLDAPHDHTVPILRCEDETGRLRHVIFGYTAHTSAAGQKLEFGGDYAGFAMVELEQSLGCTTAFLQGCAGDQKPYLPDPEQPGFPAYSIPEVHAMGRQLADAVLREIHQGRWHNVTGALTVQSRKLTLHTTLLTREGYAAWLDSDNEFFARWAREHVDLLDSGRRPTTAVSFELQAVRFGQSLVMVALAGEMSAEYGLRAVKELGRDFTQVWPLAYANEIVGYVPSDRQLPEGGYEVLANMQYIGKPGPYEPGTEEQIFKAVREMLTV
ncbi:MAG: neutral/alkaline non-lysosomal ceramidase N-terminal domain-containing protein [Cephaloticoccus sp.]|nr:neutral/alkaline non-lysosomal ceramidase N-terminal domain-containing protein [Cephaloticoccus sp.]MCF7760305.1 neutral/alkaline non-lysosomal ceramidase N-terminal domain-containing protein [Cephaloticoccus sp.]